MYLFKVNNPNDLKKLQKSDLPKLCDELRDKIIQSTLSNGGHFGSNLGVVELTVALHYVFSMPEDKIVWDVGHQTYCHKLLTERKDKFHTIRKFKGLGGFTKPAESKYDSFISGHASVSISASLGMAVADKLKGLKNHHIAVIGDGSLTGGIAFEGLNNAGASDTNLLIIINDNKMFIDPNVGALKDCLLDITTSQNYNKFRNNIKKAVRKISGSGFNVEKISKRIEHSVKNLFLKNNNFFESLNFRYFGPVDGHDVQRLIKTLENIKDIKGPKILHVLTKKGKGYLEAEKNQTKWHATNGKSNKQIEKKFTKYQDVFGYSILELAKQYDDIVAVTPAMLSGSSLTIMQNQFPERVFDTGITEQHSVTFSAGLATQGLIPFCHIYSTFAQRAYDQIIHDVAIQDLPVVFCLDRAGVVGEDGETHHGSFDLAYLNPIPNLIISSPVNEIELRNLMYTAYKNKHPFFIRYPRGNGVLENWKKPFKEIKVGTGEQIIKGNSDDVAILFMGPVGNNAIEAIKKLNKQNVFPSLYNMRFLKPLDKKLLNTIFQNHKKIITLEDGVIKGGLGSSVIEFMVENGYDAKIKKLGISDKFVQHGTLDELHKESGYDAQSIIEEVLNF
ncbi:MAG: 1-deoxy-D-xylulose-5-phosphate synthase [Candidatus Pacebacteria bacterium]|nr:1-deoxy-D-xylulose-5-phosphate synthase [Candidatus Paceibacterota bacterium]